MVEKLRRESKNRQSLNVWVNGLLAGSWMVYKNRPQQFQYSNAWVGSQQGRMLSLSLPFLPGNRPVEGDVVENFFDNLLPDNSAIRRRIQKNYNTNGISPFELLLEIGRDCVGAIQLLPQGVEPTGWDTIQARPLTDSEVEMHLHAAMSTALPSEAQGEFRISIAGAQEKTALLWHNEQWCAPVGVTPTTHIMKLPLGLVGNMRADMRSSIENEWLCSKIMAAYGIETAHCDMAKFGETKVLVVERFDRKLSQNGRYWLRLIQEDMCQALGLPPTLKYESDGGAGMSDILELLRDSRLAEQDRKSFYKVQILFWMLAATDGHAKNFSLFHDASGRYRMTPVYDVLSTWPILGEGPNLLSWHDAKLAMAFRSKNAHYKLKDIYPHNIMRAAAKLGLGGEVLTIIEELVEATADVIYEVQMLLPAGFPVHVSHAIFEGLQNSANKIQRALDVGREI